MVAVDVHKRQDASWTAVEDHHVGPDTTHSTPMLVATAQEGGAVQFPQGPGFSRIPSALVQGSMSLPSSSSESRNGGRSSRTRGSAWISHRLWIWWMATRSPMRRSARGIGSTDEVSGVTDSTTTREDSSVEVFRRGIEDGAEAVMISTAVQVSGWEQRERTVRTISAG